MKTVRAKFVKVGDEVMRKNFERDCFEGRKVAKVDDTPTGLKFEFSDGSIEMYAEAENVWIS